MISSYIRYEQDAITKLYTRGTTHDTALTRHCSRGIHWTVVDHDADKPPATLSGGPEIYLLHVQIFCKTTFRSFTKICPGPPSDLSRPLTAPIIAERIPVVFPQSASMNRIKDFKYAMLQFQGYMLESVRGRCPTA